MNNVRGVLNWRWAVIALEVVVAVACFFAGWRLINNRTADPMAADSFIGIPLVPGSSPAPAPGGGALGTAPGSDLLSRLSRDDFVMYRVQWQAIRVLVDATQAVHRKAGRTRALGRLADPKKEASTVGDISVLQDDRWRRQLAFRDRRGLNLPTPEGTEPGEPPMEAGAVLVSRRRAQGLETAGAVRSAVPGRAVISRPGRAEVETAARPVASRRNVE